LVIPFSRRHPDFAWTPWDLRDFNEDNGPIKPVDFETDPQSRTTLKLQAMYDEAARLEYPDIEYIEELLVYGMDNRAYVAGDVVLTPNYKGFFIPESFKFAADKRVAKETAFELQRIVSYGCAWPPFVHLHVNPRNVAYKPGSVPPKPRVTADYAAPRGLDSAGRRGFKPARSRDPGPTSVNAAIDLDDPLLFPTEVHMMDPRKLARAAAILQSIRACHDEPLPSELELFQVCDDMEQYYEQLPHPAGNDPENVMLVLSVAGHVDERGCFGDRGLPHCSQRLEDFFNFVTLARAREEQDRFLIPAHLQRWLTPWSEARKAAGGSGDWTVAGGFIDDSANYTYQMFADILMRVKRKMWSDFGIRVQTTKVAMFPVTRAHPSGQDMVLLGLLSAARISQLQNEPSKMLKYSELALAIAEHADDHGRRAPLEWVDRCLGQFAYASTIDHTLKGDLMVVRDQVSTQAARQLGGVVLITARAGEYLRCMGERARLATEASTAPFVCFAPRRGMMGDTGVPQLFVWTDASGSRQHVPPAGMSVLEQVLHPDLFYGWGAMYWVEGDDCVYVTQQFITYNARATLQDSTAFEFFGVTEALYVASMALRAHHFEVVHVGDSTSSTILVNGGSPHQTAERVLYWQHCDLRERLPPTLIVSSQRLRQYNKETDLLASSNVTDVPTTQAAFDKQHQSIIELHDLVSKRFGKRMRIRVIAPDSLSRSRSRMAAVVRAKASAGIKGSRNSSILPVLKQTRAAYAQSPQAHI
jgi:hypothetical protein